MISSVSSQTYIQQPEKDPVHLKGGEKDPVHLKPQPEKDTVHLSSTAQASLSADPA